MAKNNQRQVQGGRRRKKKSHKVILLLFEVLLLLILLAVAYFFGILNKIDYQELDSTEAGINKDLKESTVLALEGYTNIALFGLDNRSSNKYQSGNSDVIMIASIDNKTKKVKLVSVYRDTCLNTGDGAYHKANSAYAKGGAARAVAMLNSNLDLDITEYACVDWSAMVEIIDKLGGLDLEISEGEMKGINQYKKDVDKVTGLSTPDVTSFGLVHLDGTQATTYARLRKHLGDDYMRASRQRIVLQAMVEKAKKADLGTLLGIVNAAVSDISTTLSTEEILSLAKDVRAYSIESTTGFPFDQTSVTLRGDGDTVVAADLTSNVTQLHEYLFGAGDYSPSQTVVQTSDEIANLTGVTRDTATMNMDHVNETVGATGTGQINQSNQETEAN